MLSESVGGRAALVNVVNVISMGLHVGVVGADGDTVAWLEVDRSVGIGRIGETEHCVANMLSLSSWVAIYGAWRDSGVGGHSCR